MSSVGHGPWLVPGKGDGRVCMPGLLGEAFLTCQMGIESNWPCYGHIFVHGKPVPSS